MDAPDSSDQRKPGFFGRHQWIRWVALSVVLIAAGVYLFSIALPGSSAENLSYSKFLTAVEAGRVSDVSISADGAAAGTMKAGTLFTTAIPVVDVTLLETLKAAKVDVTAVPAATSSIWSTLAGWAFTLLPFVVLGWLWWRMARSQGDAQGLFGFARSKGKLFESTGPRTTFADVAGYEGVKAEVSEIVDFLRTPDRYRRLGAKIPRGALMVGPPGTGKTLLARAVAGEAGVPFFSVDGSSFVEMFVGVGASRVRDLFKEARTRAPAIVFIDEIDSIGQRRSGTSSFVSNDEREQTLNQLLAEMDGFDAASGVVVLAATNRPDLLDAALLRPGRFDRRISVPLPMVSERRAILMVHCLGKPIETGVDFDVIARGTPGFSGADLANLANEAAIEAVRNSRDSITQADFDAARDRLVLGRRDNSTVLLPEEKEAIAVHESGHALVAALCPRADPVSKITILPAGESLGATHQLPEVERHLYGQDYLTDDLAVRLGGRAAEIVAFGQGSSGASNDLLGATALATRMVREFGLSPRLGPVSYSHADNGSGSFFDRPYSDDTQAAVDGEVARLLREAEARAIQLITAHRGVLDLLSSLLVERETVDGGVDYDLIAAESSAVTGAGDQLRRA
ncbi:ATP-dependent zinc metalloprotease FtsH [Lacisediminihabitans sp.]|uniref:ATP-dependent zinc metalloprotease FtsH n=1 Tax=Lacisediminihabitans sp. TaxID=2787631 RepID=UPI00374D65D4